MTAGPDVLRWSWSLSRYRAWLTQDDATGCTVPAVHIRFGFTSSHHHRANWMPQGANGFELIVYAADTAALVLPGS
jgi:hypothetical protein